MAVGSVLPRRRERLSVLDHIADSVARAEVRDHFAAERRGAREVVRRGEACDLEVGSLVFGASVNGGALGEEALVTSKSVNLAPENVDPHILAGFTNNYSTSYHSLKDIAKLQPGERLCVLGAAGGIGIAAIELGKAMGATVVACASTPAKLLACKEACADVCIDYASPGFKER